MKILVLARPLTRDGTERIEKTYSRKVFFVVSYHNAVISLGDRGNEHIERTSWAPGGCSFRHEASPYKSCPFVEK
jgi:hypothetical protein